MSKAKKGGPARKKIPYKKRSCTEALIAFFSWLTTREQPIILSANHSAASIAQLIEEFRKVNRMPPARDVYPRFWTPQNMDHVTNVVTENSVAAQRSPDDVLRLVTSEIYSLGERSQNAVIAKLLAQFKFWREGNASQAKFVRDNAIDGEIKANESLREFENIISGNFTVL